MLDKILKYIDNNYEYEYNEETEICGEKIVYYEELKKFIEELKRSGKYE